MIAFDDVVVRVLALPGMQRLANLAWRVVRFLWPWRSVLRFFLGGAVAWARKTF